MLQSTGSPTVGHDCTELNRALPSGASAVQAPERGGRTHGALLSGSLGLSAPRTLRVPH